MTVTKILKKTKAKMFENLKVGDRLLFSVPLQASGRNGNSIYATYITVRNCETGETTQSSFNQLPIVLKAFSFTEDGTWYKCDHCEHQYLVYGCESACGLQSKGLGCEFKERVK